MAKRLAWMLPLAAAVTHTRRTALRHAASTIAAVAAPAGAKELYYTKEEFCRISDEQSKNGIEFGCEQYVESPEKRARMQALRAAVEQEQRKGETHRPRVRGDGRPSSARGVGSRLHAQKTKAFASSCTLARSSGSTSR